VNALFLECEAQKVQPQAKPPILNTKTSIH
jgi:hypothetical protein